METHLDEPLDIHPPLLNSLDSPKTLPGSSPPIALEKNLNPLDCHDNLSLSSEETVPDIDPSSDFDSLLEDIDSKDGEHEENELICRWPIYNYSPYWGGPWSRLLDPRPRLNPWNLAAMELEDRKASEGSTWISWSSSTDCDNKSSASSWLSENKSLIVGAGLANLGNTCFLNAILQCFTHTVPLLQGLLSSDHKVPCDGNSEGFCVFCSLYEHIQFSLISTGKIISPWKFVNNLNYFSSSFRRFQQEDAHEFLQCFLDKLESCCAGFELKDTEHSGSDNMVKQVFGGRIVSTLECCNCGHWSDTFEPSIDLSLEIEKASDLHTALESFTKLEKLEDPETKFTCENCKEQVSVEKQLLLDQVPSIAAFHLKRFKNDGSFVEKIDKYVEFPLELDLQPYTNLDQNDEELKYDLLAVVVHTGFSSTSGHYYCYIRVAPDEWYRFDDSKVRWVQEEFVLMQEAYILFYAKQGTPSFSSFIQSQKQWMDLSLLNTSPKSVLDMVDVSAASPSLLLNHCSDVNEPSDVAEAVCAEPLGGMRDSRVADSENKENSISSMLCVASDSCNVAKSGDHQSTSPSVLNNSTDVPSCEADKSASISSDGPSCEADKSASSSYVSPCEANESACLSVLKSSDDVPPCKAGKTTPRPALQENNSNQEHGEFRNIAGVMPATPSRSASPEIYREDPPDTTFSISRGHLRSMEQVSCKRQLNKDLENLERKQAYTLAKKMPGSRGQQLMAAMGGSLSDGSLNKKRRRGLHMSPSSNDRNSGSRRRSSLPLLASSLR